jgi:hypothetical protein
MTCAGAATRVQARSLSDLPLHKVRVTDAGMHACGCMQFTRVVCVPAQMYRSVRMCADVQ